MSSEEMARLEAQTKGPATEAIVIAFTILAIVSVVLRCITRFAIHKNSGAEDYLIGVAMVLSIAMGVCMIGQVKHGNGKHAQFVPLENATENLRFLFWSILAYCLSLTCIKLSILFQYKRVFYASAKMRTAVYIAGGIVVAYGIESALSGIFTCIPVRAFWILPLQATAKCVDRFPLWYANASINVFTDLVIAIMPLPCIWRLQLPLRQKIIVMFILAIGWVVCIVSILRLRALAVLQSNMQDPTYFSAETAWWSCIEVNLAIVCASLPTLRKLLSYFWPRLLDTAPYMQYNYNPEERSRTGQRSIAMKTGGTTTVSEEHILHDRVV